MTPLISPEALAPRLASPDLALLDVRASLTDPEAGLRAYRAGHLPGARFIDFDRTVCGEPTPASGRHPLPDFDQFVSALEALGVRSDTDVVIYDGGTLSFAARLWLQLRLAGFPHARVLDGGMAVWQAAKLPVTTDMPAAPVAERFEKSAPLERIWTVEEIAALVARPDGVHTIVDARPRARYLGELVTLDPVAGHIPGARSLPGDQMIGPDGRLKPANDIRALFAAVQAGRPAEGLIHTCGSGVRACTNLLAARAAGLPSAGVYVGSFSEWISDPTRPVSTKDEG